MALSKPHTGYYRPATKYSDTPLQAIGQNGHRRKILKMPYHLLKRSISPVLPTLNRLVDYYVRTSRLPDFAIADVRTPGGGLELSVRCLDPDLPELEVRCRLQTTGGSKWSKVRLRNGVGTLRWSGEGVPVRVEIDPERIHLDPGRSNNVWPEGR